MSRIEIDEDIYEYLCQHTQVIGESASSILRRLLNLPQSCRTGEGDPPRTDSPGCGLSLHPVLEGARVGSLRAAVDRFLAILAVLHRLHEKEFARVFTIGGNQRRYFAATKEEIERSGSSTQPRSIPGTSIWVVTNNDTHRKIAIIREVMNVLGYPRIEAEYVATAVGRPPQIPFVEDEPASENDNGLI